MTDTVAPLQSGPSLSDLVVADPKMLEVIAAARNVAQYGAAVLITGETGVGKEVVARIIHQHSPRGSRPWIDLNCAALPEHLVESELFGYEKGAFSGADTAKPGLFEAANGGTLFLDEIGDLDLKVQVKLLRVLDGMPYFRLGGSRKVSSDIRVLAATNRDLEAAVRDGSFRRDFYHRISEVHLHIPALRQRPQDIAALAKHFLTQTLPQSSFTEDALELLMHFEWRGNVRELRNFVLKLAMTNSSSEIGSEEIRRHLPEETHSTPTASAVREPEVVSVAEMERQMIVRALELTGGNQTRAAERLGMPRRTFCRKLQQFDIAGERRRGAPRKPDSEPAPDRRKEISVLVSLLTEAGQRIAASARNLSLGGMGLRNLQAPLESGSKLTVSLTTPGSGQPLDLRAVVAWSHSNGSAGLCFGDLSETQRDALQRWIAAPLRSSLPALRALPKSASYNSTPLS
jgi:DNA-binding NtrC family response regulator